MVGTLLGLLLAALDQTIVATAGPAIQKDLHVAPSVYPWLTSAYLVASTVMVPIYGKLSDIYGRKPILLTGIGIFLLGSLLCGISGATPALLAARAVQGTGSAALFTSAFAVVADIFAPAERGKYQGIFGACFALSSVIGPLLGGFLTDAFSWHWVFFVNLPLGALAIGFIVAKMPMLQRPHTGPVPIDFAGAFWLLACVVPFLVALSLTRGGGSSLATRWIPALLIALSALSLFGFLRAERRARNPLLDLRLFDNRIFKLGNLAAFVLGADFIGSIVFLPLFMVNVVGLSATDAGLTLTPLTFGIVFGNIMSGQIVSRVGRYRALMLVGNVVLLAGIALLAFTLRPDTTQREATLKMIVLGLGLGPTIPLYTLAIQNAAPPKDLGVATAAATFFRQIGSTVGVTVLGLALATGLAAHLAPLTPPPGLPAIDERPIAGDSTTLVLRVDTNAYLAAIDRAPHGDRAWHTQRLADLKAYDHATKAAFTRATRRIYDWALVIGVIGLCVTIALPDARLRKGPSARPSS